MTEETTNPVFISYSQKDKEWLDKLKTMLNPLIRAKTVDVWWDGKVMVSQKWREEISKALKSAKIALLLISPNFLDSDFIVF